MRLKSSTLGWKIMLNYDAHFGEFTQKWNFLGYDVILPKILGQEIVGPKQSLAEQCQG